VPTPDEVFPPGFFDRDDPSPDTDFYAPPRLVTHIDDGAIAAVGALYTELGLDGECSTSCRRGCRTSSGRRGGWSGWG
jgi:hypothetical protein